jgi:hypothetical protein
MRDNDRVIVHIDNPNLGVDLARDLVHELARALNPGATHENTLVMRRSLGDDED